MDYTLAALSIYLFMAVILAAYLMTYALAKGRAQINLVFAGLAAAVMLYLFGYSMELNSTSQEQKLFWNQLQHFGIPFFPPLWAILSLLYSTRILRLNRYLMVGFFSIPAISFILRMTDHLHHLYSVSWEIRTIGGLQFLFLEKGYWYWVDVAFVTVCFLMATVVFWQSSQKAAPSQRVGYRLMLISSLMPFMGLVLILLEFGGGGIDYAAMVFPVTLVGLLFALFRYDVLAINAMARETIFEDSSDAMVLMDSQNGLIDCNPAAKRLFRDLTTVQYRQSLDKILLDSNGLESLLHLEEEPKDLVFIVGDQKLNYEAKLRDCLDVHQHPIGRLLSLKDVTKRKQGEEALRRSEDKLRVMATTDELTGLANRARFMEQGRYEVARLGRYGQSFSLLIMDIDYFKKINDTFGHGGGDVVLRHLGAFMRNNFRCTDFLGRLGGEEFGAILPSTSLDGAWCAAESFRKRVAQEEILYEGQPIGLTLSIGIGASTPDLVDFETIVKTADRALYRSKDSGRNCSTMAEVT